jgi:hypothetical protein
MVHWDNMPVHSTAIIKNCLAVRVIQVLPHPAYLPDLALVDFFLFRKVNLSQESLKNAWVGVLRTIAKEDFAIALSWWFEQCKKCTRIGVATLRKVEKKNSVLAITIVTLVKKIQV